MPMYLFFFFAILLLPALAACTQQPVMAPVMIANPLLVEENIHLAETKQALAAETGGNPAKANQPAAQKDSDDKRYYLVKPGDSLSSIAAATAKDLKQLAQWNQLSPPYQVNAGQKLNLVAPEPADANIPKNNAVAKMPVVKTSPSDVADKAQPALKNGLEKQPVKTVLPPAGKAIVPNKNPAAITALPEKKPNPDNGQMANNTGKALSKTAASAARSQTAPGNPAPELTGQQAKNLKQKNQLPLSPDRNGKPVNPIKSAADAKAADQNAAQNASVKGQKKAGISIENKKMLKLNFQWPVKGAISKDFSQSHGKGIDITAKQDKQAVNAAEAGKVVYQGQGLSGFKNLIIIKHNDEYLTAYANNSRSLVKEGQQVSKGQAIAEIGAAGNQQKPLHFEIRKNGNPINPLEFLPK